MKMTFRTIVIGGLIVFFAVVTVVVFIPELVWNPPQTTRRPRLRAGAGARAEMLFFSNGCNYCHTQYVRAKTPPWAPCPRVATTSSTTP